jgi:hypothetical protein
MTEAVQALQPGISLAPDTSSVVDRGKFERDAKTVQSLEKTFATVDDIFKSPDSFLTFLGTNQVAQIGISTVLSIVPPVRVAFEAISTGYVRYKKACAENAGFAEKFKIIGEYGLRTGAAFATGGVSELAFAAGRGAISLLQGKPKWESLAYAATAFAGGIAGGSLAGSLASAPVTRALFVNAGRLAGAEFTGHLIEKAIGDEDKKHDFRIARAGVAGLMSAVALAQAYPLTIKAGATQGIQEGLIDFKEEQLDGWNDRLQKFFNPDDYAPTSPDTAEPTISSPTIKEGMSIRDTKSILYHTNKNTNSETYQDSSPIVQSSSKGLYGHASHIDLRDSRSTLSSTISPTTTETATIEASAPPPTPGMGEFTEYDIKSFEATLAAASTQTGLEPHPTLPNQYRYTLPDNLNVEDTIGAINPFIRDAVNIEVATPFARSYDPANPSTENTVSFDFTFAHPSGNTYTIPVELNNREFVAYSSAPSSGTFSAYISEKAESSMLSRGLFYDPSGNPISDRNSNGIIDLEDFEITWDMPRSTADNHRYTRIFHNNLWNQAVNNTPELRANLDPTLPNDPNYPTNFYGPLDLRGKNDITLAESAAAAMNHHLSDQTALVRNIASIPYLRDVVVGGYLGNTPPNIADPAVVQDILTTGQTWLMNVSRYSTSTGEPVEIKVDGTTVILDPTNSVTDGNVIHDTNGDGVISVAELRSQLTTLNPRTAEVADRNVVQALMRAAETTQTQVQQAARFDNLTSSPGLSFDGSTPIILYRDGPTATGYPQNITITPTTQGTSQVFEVSTTVRGTPAVIGTATNFTDLAGILESNLGRKDPNTILNAFSAGVKATTGFDETTSPHTYTSPIFGRNVTTTQTPASMIVEDLTGTTSIFDSRGDIATRGEFDNTTETIQDTIDAARIIGRDTLDTLQTNATAVVTGTEALANFVQTQAVTPTAQFTAAISATMPTEDEVISKTVEIGIDAVNTAKDIGTAIERGVEELDNINPGQAEDIGRNLTDQYVEPVVEKGHTAGAFGWGAVSQFFINLWNRIFPTRP